ncbi:MAG: hypothetical protein ACRDKL_00775 [Solirubrobacteraceae bacterium]
MLRCADVERILRTFRNMFSRLRLQLGQDVGQGLTEYALVLALVALVAIGGLSVFGGAVAAQISTVATSVTRTAQTTPAPPARKCTRARHKKGKC